MIAMLLNPSVSVESGNVGSLCCLRIFTRIEISLRTHIEIVPETLEMVSLLIFRLEQHYTFFPLP